MNNNICEKHHNFVGEVCPVCLSDENIRLQKDVEYYKLDSEAARKVIEKLLGDPNNNKFCSNCYWWKGISYHYCNLAYEGGRGLWCAGTLHTAPDHYCNEWEDKGK